MENCNLTFRDNRETPGSFGGPSYITGAPVGNYALTFDGSHNYMDVNEELYFTGANTIPALTITCWYKVDGDCYVVHTLTVIPDSKPVFTF